MQYLYKANPTWPKCRWTRAIHQADCIRIPEPSQGDSVNDALCRPSRNERKMLSSLWSHCEITCNLPGALHFSKCCNDNYNYGWLWSHCFVFLRGWVESQWVYCLLLGLRYIKIPNFNGSSRNRTWPVETSTRAAVDSRFELADLLVGAVMGRYSRSRVRLGGE